MTELLVPLKEHLSRFTAQPAGDRSMIATSIPLLVDREVVLVISHAYSSSEDLKGLLLSVSLMIFSASDFRLIKNVVRLSPRLEHTGEEGRGEPLRFYPYSAPISPPQDLN